MKKIIFLCALLGLAANGKASDNDLETTANINCNNQKCNFECIVDGRWNHLGNTKKGAGQATGFEMSTKSGILTVVLANEGDPVLYKISTDLAFCRFTPA